MRLYSCPDRGYCKALGQTLIFAQFAPPLKANFPAVSAFAWLLFGDLLRARMQRMRNQKLKHFLSHVRSH
jgi:hypothetical protein